MSDCDAAILAAAAGRTDAVVAAVSKIDLHRTWPAVLDRNRTASAHWRPVPWVGVAADPDIGPVVIDPLVDAIRAQLDHKDRRHRNLLRTREWMLQRRIAGIGHEAAARATLRAQSARRAAVRVRVQQARLHLAARARASSAALRAEVQSEAAVASRRGCESLGDRTYRRAQQVADEFDDAVAACMAEIAADAGTAVPALGPPPPVRTCLPPPRPAVQEDRLAAVFGTGFGIGVALTLGRFLVEVVPAARPAVVPLCGGVGLALAAWVVHTRRLLTARAALDRWAVEVAAGMRTALEERALAAETALVEACIGVTGLVEPTNRATASPTVEAWNGELSRIRAELVAGRGSNPHYGRLELSHNPN